MIPDFEADGTLPAGVHRATWPEIVDRFGRSPRRQLLLRGLRRALDDLRAAGCRLVYVDGSFVSAAPDPGDFDACWESDGVAAADLHPAIIQYHGQRGAMKARYRGELFPADALADWDGTSFLDYFQRDKDTGRRKGIIALDLEDEP